MTATVTPTLGDVAIDMLWTLNPPATRSAADFEQDIYVLWPGEIVGELPAVQADPKLERYIETRGFTVISSGRVPLSARSAYELESDAPPEVIRGGATFVTFVRQGGALGLTTPATYMHVPWHPKMTNRAWLMSLRFQARGMLKPKPATWLEATFSGRRNRFELTFNDMRPRAVFPLYFESRERVLRLADDPSQLVMQFAQATNLKIDEITPGSAVRRRHESLEQTEVVSRFLDTSEGIAPQALTIQFGYFSELQSWAPIVIPIVFFLLGNLLRPPLQSLGAKVVRVAGARLAIFPRRGVAERQTGVVLTREQLAGIVPGETTKRQVLALAPGPPEEFEQYHDPEHRTLIFRGRRLFPHRSRRFWFVTAVDGWDVEEHEVEVELANDVVRNVHARVRRAELDEPPR